jgi:hypothetical protein
MAFQTPPTFVDGNVLSASQLNILAANQNELAGLSTGVNLGFPDTGIPTDESRYFYVIHAWNNLYLSYSLPTNDSSLRVYYGATLVYTSTGNAGSYTVNVDLTSFGLTLGQAYSVRLRADSDAASSVGYMCESESAL